MSAESELSEYQLNKELLNRLVSIHETPFKLPQRFWSIREQEADSVPLDVVERAITDLNLGIKSQTQKTFSPLTIRKFVESMEHERLQQAHPKPANYPSVPPFDPHDPLSWLSSCPNELDVGTTNDMTSARRYAEMRRIIERKIHEYIAAKKQMEHYLKTYNDINKLDITSLQHIDQDSELFKEIRRTSQLTNRLITNLERMHITSIPHVKQAEEVKSIDSITKGLLWQ